MIQGLRHSRRRIAGGLSRPSTAFVYDGPKVCWLLPACDRPLMSAAAFSDCRCSMSGTAADLLQFVNSSPTPFHLVSHAEQILRAARFTKGRRKHLMQIEMN